MVLFVVSSVKIFSLFKQERDERNIFLSFFSNKQTKFFKRNVAWEYKTKTRSLSLARLKKQIYSKKKKSIPLREDEDARVKVVFVTFVLPQFLFFLAPFREEEEEEENKFGGR